MSEPRFEGWAAVAIDLEARVRADGFWWGEARILREAAGVRRFGPANWAAICQRLMDAGLEPVPADQPIESDPLYVRPVGWAMWDRAGRLLLDAMDFTENEVPKEALSRPALVRERAIDRWVAAMRRRGWRFEPAEDGHADV